MKSLLKDKNYLTLDEADQYFKLVEALTFDNPKHAEALQFGRSVRSIERSIELYGNINGGLSIPRGVSLDWLVYDSIEDQRTTHPVTISASIEPRPYQQRVIDIAASTDGGVIVAPTGSGKTAMAIAIAARLGQRCLILVKSADLAQQWQTAIQTFTGLDAGRIGGGKWQEGEAFTVAMIQTLAKQPADLDAGLVIVDECHNIPAHQAFSVVNRQSAKYRFGLSATPQRRDNLEFMIHAALGPVIATVQDSELAGSVLPVAVSAVEHPFTDQPASWSEFIDCLAANPARNRLLVDKAIKSNRTIGTVVLTATVSHAEALHRLMTDRGEAALLLHGQLRKTERAQRMNAANNAPLIVGTLSLLSEGIDWPHIGSVIFAAPVSAAVDKKDPAATRLLQSIGRARRPHPKKVRAHVLDVIDQHPFGIAAYRKRLEVYRQHGFAILPPGRNTP